MVLLMLILSVIQQETFLMVTDMDAYYYLDEAITCCLKTDKPSYNELIIWYSIIGLI